MIYTTHKAPLSIGDVLIFLNQLVATFVILKDPKYEREIE